jgi:hypothetical protein
MKKMITILGLILAPAIAMGYSSGPPNEVTGAPGEGTCVDCHTSFPLNSGNGSLTIVGPSQFIAGHTYPIVVTIQDPGQQRWGFEFTPLTQGTIAITDATHTQVQTVGGKAYVKHTSSGTFNGVPNGPTAWTFNWTAPANPPTQITFYAAGNAANGNANNQGDYIYSTSFTASLTTAIDDPFAVNVLPNDMGISNYPNPFNAETKISFNLAESGPVDLKIYDITGRAVRQLVHEDRPAGLSQLIWDGRNDNGSNLVSGVYFARLVTGSVAKTHRLVLLK